MTFQNAELSLEKVLCEKKKEIKSMSLCSWGIWWSGSLSSVYDRMRSSKAVMVVWVNSDTEKGEYQAAKSIRDIFISIQLLSQGPEVILWFAFYLYVEISC